MELQELNHWWVEGEVRKDFAPPTYRDLFHEVKKDLGRRQVQVIVGLRRTGKSTIFFQLVDYLTKERKVEPSRILYCSFDEPELQEKGIEDILKEYSKITDVDYGKEKIYLFLDEVQKARNWVASVKLVYDNLRNIKILVSGSASLNILSDAKKSLAGRVIYYELRPLSFKEFLRLKGIRVEEKKFLLYKNVLEREFNKFVSRPFPELVNEKDAVFIKNHVRNSVIEPIILKDIPKEFKEVDILLLEKLANVFLANPGQYLLLDEIAKELRRTKTTIYNALFYLEYSFLVKRVFNYRPSLRVASRKLSRIYAYHPCLTLPFNVPEEKRAENMILFELSAKYYWREKEKEIDFLKESTEGVTLVEVKLKSKIDKSDLKWINYFTKKYGERVRKAFVVTKDVEGRIGGVRLIPLWKFCFTGLKSI